MAISMSGNTKLECGQDQNVTAVSAALVETRLITDFHFQNKLVFEDILCLS